MISILGTAIGTYIGIKLGYLIINLLSKSKDDELE